MFGHAFVVAVAFMCNIKTCYGILSSLMSGHLCPEGIIGWPKEEALLDGIRMICVTNLDYTS
jgi:hypothetical protein